MRDSGVEWLGEVPEHWERRRLKFVLRAVDERSTTGGESLLSLRRDHGVVVYADHFARPPQGATLVGFKLVAIGQLVVNRLQANNGLVFRSAVDGLVSPDYSVFERKIPIRMQYLSDLLRTAAYRSHFRRVARGLGTGTAGFLRLYDDTLLTTPIFLPSIKEQHAIACFLNHANRRIRRYIRAKEGLIALLDEERQAVIHQAVTGRIDVRTSQPYPAYKASDVEWLGNIPAHWGRCRLRNVVSRVTTGSREWSRYSADTGPLFVRVANLSRGSLEMRFDDIVRLDLPSTSEATRTRIKEEDVLLSVTAYIGSVAVAPVGFEEAYVSQHVARCEPSPRVSSKWLGYVLLSRLGQVHGQMSLYGGTKDGLSLDDVKNYPIVMPPRDEQDRLVRWIERELSLLGELRDQVQRQIALFREYRTRLIADVVTGQVDVREAAGTVLTSPSLGVA